VIPITCTWLIHAADIKGLEPVFDLLEKDVGS